MIGVVGDVGVGPNYRGSRLVGIPRKQHSGHLKKDAL